MKSGRRGSSEASFASFFVSQFFSRLLSFAKEPSMQITEVGNTASYESTLLLSLNQQQGLLKVITSKKGVHRKGSNRAQ